MKQALALLAVALMSAMSAQAQTATDLNEGQRVTTSATTGVFTLSWWGQAGRTYFIQQSFDLMTWQYVPTIVSGAAAVTGMNFSCADSRQFWRLRYTDAPTGGNAQTADFDLDGRSNQQELDAGTDIFSADTDGDGFGDGTEALAGTDAKSAASNPVADLNDVPQFQVAYLLSGYGSLYYFAAHLVSQAENNPALWLVSKASTIPGNLYFSAYGVNGTMPAVPALPARPDADSNLSSWSNYYYAGNDPSMVLLRLVDGDSSGPDFFTGYPVNSRESRLTGYACKYKLTVWFPSRNARTIKLVEQKTKQPVLYNRESGYLGAGSLVVTDSQVRTLTLPANATETTAIILQPDEADANFRTTATVAKALFITPAGDPVNGPVDAGDVPASIPDGANEFTFSNAATGVLTLTLKVHLPGVVDQSPADQAKYTFEVDAIGSSVLSWPTGADGKATVSGEYLTATAIFTGLPQNNSDFGSKNVRLKFDGIEVASSGFELFFMRDERNHPNGQVGSPNWYHYWGQTNAKFGTHEYLPGGGGGYTAFYLGSWRSFIQDGAPSHTQGGTWNNAGGIDLYANVTRHEETHRTQLIALWGAASGWVAADDVDLDFLKDSMEASLITGHPYDPSNASTYSDTFNYNAAPGGKLRDAEDYCLRQQPAWTNGAANSKDWSNPGMQHKTLNDSDD